MYMRELETLVLIPFWAVALEEVGGAKAPKNRKGICASVQMSSVFPLWRLPQALPRPLKRCLRLLRSELRPLQAWFRSLRDWPRPLRGHHCFISYHIVGYNLEYCKNVRGKRKKMWARL